jgi:hypothetical protein
VRYVFAPWKIEPEPVELGPIEVAGPPCLHCLHWRPRAIVRESELSLKDGTPFRYFDGVRLCHAEEQWRDFSCYVPKDEGGHS